MDAAGTEWIDFYDCFRERNHPFKTQFYQLPQPDVLSKMLMTLFILELQC